MNTVLRCKIIIGYFFTEMFFFGAFVLKICLNFTSCNKAYVTFLVDLEKQTLSQNTVSNICSGIFVLYGRLIFLLFLFLFSCSVICYQKMQEMNL